jgi:hypothetical protein
MTWDVNGKLYRFAYIHGHRYGRGRKGWLRHVLALPAGTEKTEVSAYESALCGATPTTDSGWWLDDDWRDWDACPRCRKKLRGTLATYRSLLEYELRHTEERLRQVGSKD